jgi:hypothetical protein
MQVAASFDIFKKHKETVARFSDSAARKAYHDTLLAAPKTDLNTKLLAAINT